MSRETEKPFELYEQETNYGCGPASLLIVYRALGFDYTERQLERELGTDKDGTEWGGMIIHPCEQGLNVTWNGNATYEDLAAWSREGPTIASVMSYVNKKPEGHFVVVREVDDEAVGILDPATGKQDLYLKEEWLRLWRDDQAKRCFMTIRTPLGDY